MSAVTTHKLAEFATILSGYAFDSGSFGEIGEIPIIRIRDVVRGYSNTFYTGDFSNTFVINNGDLLVGMDGDFNTAIWQGGKAVLNQRVCKIDHDQKIIDQTYLYYLLPRELKKIWDATSFVTVKHLSVKALQAIEIPLPPLPEQKRIAAILNKADSIRRKRQEAVRLTEELLRSVFLDMFGDPVTNPKGWESIQLAGVCNSPDDIKCGPFGTQLGKDEFTTEGVPLWGIRNVNKLFKLPTHEFLEPRTAQRLIQYSIEPGDIVMTRKGTIGNCAVYPENFPLGIMHSDLLRLRLNRKICEPAFLAHQLHYSRAVEQQIELISGGAVMPGINVTKLKYLEVLVPPIEIQSEFTRRTASIKKLNNSHSISLASFDALFNSLLQSAFKGML